MELMSKHKWVNVVGVIIIILGGIALYDERIKQKDESKNINATEFNYDEEIKQKNENKNINVTEFSYDDMHVKYIKHEVVENMSGDKCLVIYYEFTNNSNENKAFIYSFSDKAFQDGIELDFSIFHVNEESKNSDREIQPGVTITVASGFVIKSNSIVTLQIEPFISFSDEKLMEMQLSIE